MKRRLGTAVLAILLALLGTAGVLGYVREANVRALAGQKAETVLVATQMIPAGTSAGLAQTDGWLRQETFPVASIPPGAIGLLSGSISGLVVNAQVQPGELLLRPMLVRAVQSANGLAIPTGMVMTTLQLCLSQAVAGYIHPGSEVAVFETVGTGTITQSNCSPTTEQLKNVRTQVVLPKVLVLAVGPAPAAGGSSATASRTGLTQAASAPSAQTSIMLSLAVTQGEAEQLITLSQTGLPYLALLTPSSQVGFDGSTRPLTNPAGG